MKKLLFKNLFLFSLFALTSCTPVLRTLVETEGRDYEKKLITLKFDNQEVKVVERKKIQTKYNDLVIFMGVTTFEKNYLPLYPYLKDMNIFVIHTPEHGYDEEMSNGDLIKNADDLTIFQTKVVKELIAKKYTTEKVNILGYSMGGMTLINILNKHLLDNEIDHPILVSTNRSNDALRNKENNRLFNKMLDLQKYDSKFFLEECYSEDTPFYVRLIGGEPFAVTDKACLGDFSCVKDFERVAKEEKIKEITKKTLYISGEKDNIFNWSRVRSFSRNFSNVTLKKVSSGHLSLIERPWESGKIIMDYLSIYSKK